MRCRLGPVEACDVRIDGRSEVQVVEARGGPLPAALWIGEG